MSLLVDANAYGIAETIINISILKQIEDDLDLDEKISILFLIMEDYTNAFREIFKLFQEVRTKNIYIITDYVKNHPRNWKDKILEALCILDNREVIKKLRVSNNDLDLLYFPKIRSCSKNINVIAKCLYEICESLDENEQKLLLNYIKSEDLCNYEPTLHNINYLELHMLYWMQIQYITISKDKKYNMKKLLKHLKKFEGLKILCMDLEKFGNHLHVVDTHGTIAPNDKNYDQSVSLEELSLAERHDGKQIRPINNGLCIIINQIYFGKEYETRFGTSADCANLSEIFQTFGFKVCLLKNLKKKEMLENIKDIPKNHGTNYDCVFLCILSHGYKGGIITTDEKELSLETIEKTFCCMELKDVMKIVIIQACQGKTRGNINNCLATDGLFDSSTSISEDIRQFENFFMFMSTIQGFVSIRHKEQGSWFIQEFCKILKTYGNRLSFLECVRKVMISVRKKQGTIEGSRIAQLSEIRQDRLNSDFQLSVVASSN